MKRYVLFDHDGVLVDTEFWYYRAGERALADVGLRLDKEQYLRDMSRGLGTWAQARAAGLDEVTIGRQRKVRDAYYQEYLRTEAIEIDGVAEALAPYLTGLKRFGAAAQETLVVEDSSRGLNSAVAAGIDCAVVHNDFTRGQDFSPATYRISRLGELTEIILGGGADA